LSVKQNLSVGILNELVWSCALSVQGTTGVYHQLPLKEGVTLWHWEHLASQCRSWAFTDFTWLWGSNHSNLYPHLPDK